MPSFRIRCPTPDEPPQDAGGSRLEAPGGRASIDELRELVAEHAALVGGADGHLRRAPAEPEYYAAAGRVLARLQGAVHDAAGPCASGPVPPAEVASFDRLAAELAGEFDAHRARPASGEEEARHRHVALDRLDAIEQAYDDVERDARHRARVGCLWRGDV